MSPERSEGWYAVVGMADLTWSQSVANVCTLFVSCWLSETNSIEGPAAGTLHVAGAEAGLWFAIATLTAASSREVRAQQNAP